MTRVRAAGIFAICLIASTAGAQDITPRVTLVPSNAARWDVSAHLTWLGERRTDPSFEWDRWFGVASGGGTVGYHWTPHLKTEFDLATSSEGESYSVEIIPVPGLTNPLFIQRDHEIRFTTASAGLTSQFFENAWFHPFVGAGIELVREREHIELEPLPVAPRDPRAPTIAELLQEETVVRYSGRPYVATGFKVYFSDRAFFRTDVRTSWSRDGLAALGWRTGVGVDF